MKDQKTLFEFFLQFPEVVEGKVCVVVIVCVGVSGSVVVGVVLKVVNSQ